MDGGRNTEFTSGRFYMLNRRAERAPGSKVEGYRDRRKDALMIHGKRRIRRLVMRKGAERHELAAGGRHIDGFESGRILLCAGHDFQNDVVLIESLVDRRDLTLAKSVIQGVIDGLHGDTEAAGGVAVDHERSLEAMGLLVRVNVTQLRDFRQARLQQRRPVVEVFQTIRLKGVLVLSGSEARANVEILNRLKKEHRAGDVFRGFPDARDDLVRADFAFRKRL